MKNISVASMIEVLTMGVQAGFVDSPEEIDAVASIVSGMTRSFMKECEETDTLTLPTDEIREVISSAEEFITVVINNHNIDFVDEDESHGVCLSIIEITRVLGGLKALVKSKW